jgi:hypothetical protein
MSEHNEQVVRRLIDAFDRHDFDALDDLLADAFLWHGGSFGEIEGREAFKELAAPFYAAFPDLRRLLLRLGAALRLRSVGGPHQGGSGRRWCIALPVFAARTELSEPQRGRNQTRRSTPPAGSRSGRRSKGSDPRARSFRASLPGPRRWSECSLAACSSGRPCRPPSRRCAPG